MAQAPVQRVGGSGVERPAPEAPAEFAELLQSAPRHALGLTALIALSVACARPAARCAECQSTVVVAAVGEPSALVPPLVYETIGRDIGDLVYERLADLTAGRPPADTAAYRPGLAASWERLDSLTWRFHLRPGAHWQDGPPVTAEDERFSFDAFSDPVL
ncbi:MAG: ABC transporter substrate-binding protein, partial [Gemmatimonadales bacterium]